MNKKRRTVPPDLGVAAPYVQHFWDLGEGGEPAMAYFCGLYACHLGIVADADIKRRHAPFLASLLDELDALKSTLREHPALQSDAASFAHVVQQASRLFVSADDEERAGVATAATAQAFATSAHFLQTGKLFRSPFPSELEDRCKYARLKAIEIRKRPVSSSHDPSPHDPSPHDPFNSPSHNPSHGPSNSYPSHGLPPADVTAPNALDSPAQLSRADSLANKPTYPPTSGIPTLAKSPSATIKAPFTTEEAARRKGEEDKRLVLGMNMLPSFLGTLGPQKSNHDVDYDDVDSHDHDNDAVVSRVRVDRLAKAEKHARQAVSAIQFEDVRTARDHLQRALHELGHGN